MGRDKTRTIKVIFELEQDADGYPPVGSEALWACEREEGIFELDNIPFFARQVSSGDLVRATRNEWGEWIFTEIVKPSGNSTFRLCIYDESRVQKVRDDLRALGCPSELANIPKLIAVEVPAESPIDPFLNYIVTGREKGEFEYQEAALRHTLPP